MRQFTHKSPQADGPCSPEYDHLGQTPPARTIASKATKINNAQKDPFICILSLKHSHNSPPPRLRLEQRPEVTPLSLLLSFRLSSFFELAVPTFDGRTRTQAMQTLPDIPTSALVAFQCDCDHYARLSEYLPQKFGSVRPRDIEFKLKKIPTPGPRAPIAEHKQGNKNKEMSIYRLLLS